MAATGLQAIFAWVTLAPKLLQHFKCANALLSAPSVLSCQCLCSECSESQQWQAEFQTGQYTCPAYLLTVPDAKCCCFWQIHLACPQTLLPVLPLLIHELQVEVEGKRLDAIDVLGKLFTMPGSDMDQEYSYLFEEFLRRCKDQKVKSFSSEG